MKLGPYIDVHTGREYHTVRSGLSWFAYRQYTDGGEPPRAISNADANRKFHRVAMLPVLRDARQEKELGE